ncbi:hypothetical protein M569_02584 [Genlisea aurea]|uniref:Protein TRIGALACTOSYLDIACYLGLYCEROL 4, chloroplastic n=1 Tax=Genlisea aurea TaxID=192259 RepID=S8CYV2_9LAMI|nr:hypothetical protein M569_02584 [Genlisea aurea]
MANLKSTMDAAFWDMNVSTPLALDGVSRCIPGEPVPLDASRSSKLLRIQQLSFLGNGFPLGIIPSLSPSPNHKELGSFSLQSLLGKYDAGDWWAGLVGQFRPKKLISSIKAEVSGAEEWEPTLLKDVMRHFLDKSLYAFGLWSQIDLPSSTSLLLSAHKHGERNPFSKKVALYHTARSSKSPLIYHDINLEVAWPDLFMDRKGKYWEVPGSVSLDISSVISDSGLRYHFGIHGNSGTPTSFEPVKGEVPPPSLLPGICSKAAFSYEKTRDFWRSVERKDDDALELIPKRQQIPSPYDVRLKEPHGAVTWIVGSNCEAWVLSRETNKRSRFAADLFCSLSCSFQHGKFTKDYGDLTRIDARLDVASASAVVKRLFNSSEKHSYAPSLPRLNLIFQQQMAGPIVGRVDAMLSPERGGPVLEDLILSLCYSLRLLQSGKVVAWYSPKRREGMIELKMFEF